MSQIPDFATLDPFHGMIPEAPGIVHNLLDGSWHIASSIRQDIPDPLHGGEFLRVPDTTDVQPFIDSLARCPKTGLHNPWKQPQRYLMLGDVCARAAARLAEPAVEEYFVRLLQRVMPKSRLQCLNEVVVTRVFLENFAGDRVRFLGRGFSNPGNHPGQESRGYRWPWGPVAVVAPFNFPLEIPALQVMGALFMGNKPLVKVDSKVSAVFEQFLRLLIDCGLPPGDVDLIHCRGRVMGELIEQAKSTLRMVQFTGSSDVAEIIADVMNGRVRWKMQALTGKYWGRTLIPRGWTTWPGSAMRTLTTRPDRNVRRKVFCLRMRTGLRRCCPSWATLRVVAAWRICRWARC